MPVVNYETPADTLATLSPETMLGAWSGSAALVYCRDWEGRILAANPAFARKFGRMPAELCGRPSGEYLHPDDSPALQAATVALRKPPHRASCENRWLTPQGWRWISWEEALVVLDNAGMPVAIRSVGHDITRQRMAEEQYYKLSRAVEQSPVAMMITDAEGQVQYVNAKFTDITGVTLEQIIEGNIQVLREVHPDDESYEAFWETIRAGKEWHGEHVHHRPDGRKVWESVQVSCLRNSAGEITNLLCLREDITERRELEEKLRQAQKMESLGTLAGGIAHDFNNIIAIINGYAQLAQLKQGDPATLQKSVNEIRRATERASGLVRQILTFSRKADVSFVALDLNQLTRELTALLSETFPRNVSFHYAFEEKLPPLLADQNQLQQIILNLCVNARDAMPNGGTLTLMTNRVEGRALPPNLKQSRTYACLAVNDTGTGMTPEVCGRIFEPFFTTKAVNQGTGLGLAVVYGIVAAHDGTITVDSQVGVGSTFRVYLPLAEAAAIPAALARATQFPSGNESLLVVDDEPPLRVLLDAALTRKGYQVTAAADGLEAIKLLKQPEIHFDAVLLDLNMPGANGLEVCKFITAHRPELKVLVLTGLLTQQLRTQFEELGHNKFVKKPYSLDEIGRNLRQLLEGDPA